jgi:hypothetical protein
MSLSPRTRKSAKSKIEAASLPSGRASLIRKRGQVLGDVPRAEKVWELAKVKFEDNLRLLRDLSA